MNIDPIELKLLTPMAQLYFPKLKTMHTYPKKPVSSVVIVDADDRLHLGSYFVIDSKIGVEQEATLKPADRRRAPWNKAFAGDWKIVPSEKPGYVADLQLGRLSWPYRPGFELIAQATIRVRAIVSFDEYRTLVSRKEE